MVWTAGEEALQTAARRWHAGASADVRQGRGMKKASEHQEALRFCLEGSLEVMPYVSILKFLTSSAKCK